MGILIQIPIPILIPKNKGPLSFYTQQAFLYVLPDGPEHPFLPLYANEILIDIVSYWSF